MPHSVLVVPVPEAVGVVPDAHITLLSPFATKEELTDGLLGELEEFFADVVPFAFRLTDLAQFPGGTLYLSPEPVAPFRSMTHELHRLFPEYPPYGGQFDDVIPHLSVPATTADEAVRMPITANARGVQLWWLNDDRTIEVLETFPFGTTAA